MALPKSMTRIALLAGSRLPTLRGAGGRRAVSDPHSQLAHAQGKAAGHHDRDCGRRLPFPRHREENEHPPPQRLYHKARQRVTHSGRAVGLPGSSTGGAACLAKDTDVKHSLGVGRRVLADLVVQHQDVFCKGKQAYKAEAQCEQQRSAPGWFSALAASQARTQVLSSTASHWPLLPDQAQAPAECNAGCKCTSYTA